MVGEIIIGVLITTGTIAGIAIVGVVAGTHGTILTTIRGITLITEIAGITLTLTIHGTMVGELLQAQACIGDITTVGTHGIILTTTTIGITAGEITTLFGTLIDNLPKYKWDPERQRVEVALL